MQASSVGDLSQRQHEEMWGWGDHFEEVFQENCPDNVSPRQFEEIKCSEDRFEEIYRLLAKSLEYIRLNGKSSLRPIQREYECLASEIRLIRSGQLSQIGRLSEQIDALSRRALGAKECDHELRKIYKGLERAYLDELHEIFQSSELKGDPYLTFSEEMHKQGKANFLGLLRDNPNLKMLKPKLYPVLNREIRHVFDKKLAEIRTLNDKSPTCFICYNVHEKDVVSWIEKVLLKDLWAIGVRPVWSRYHLYVGLSLDGFMLRAGIEDFATVICTPAAKKKWQENSSCGMAQEIKLMKETRVQEKKGTYIPILFKKNEGEDPNHVNPFQGGDDEPFGVCATLENYAGILHFFVTMKVKERNECRRVADTYLGELISEGDKILEDLINLQRKMTDHVDFNDTDLGLLNKNYVFSSVSEDLFFPPCEEDFVLQDLEKSIRHYRKLRSNARTARKEEDRNWQSCIGKITLTRYDLPRIRDKFESKYKTIDRKSKEDRLLYKKRLAVAMHVEARIYYELGEYQDAINLYFKLLALNQKDDRAHRGLARIYMICKEFDKAEDHIVCAMSVPEPKEDSIVEYAILMLRQGRYAEAIAQLSKVTRGDGDDLHYQFTDSGSLFEELNSELHDRKKMTLRADQLTYFLLGKANLKLGNKTEARKAADLLRALLRLNHSPLCSKLLGFLYAELEDFKEAQVVFGF